MFKGVDPICDWCNQEAATHIHMFWSYLMLTTYWQSFFDNLSEVTRKRLIPDGITALFEVTPTATLLSTEIKLFIAFASLLTRHLILLKWKLHTPLLHIHWVRDVVYFAKLEKNEIYWRPNSWRFGTLFLIMLGSWSFQIIWNKMNTSHSNHK